MAVFSTIKSTACCRLQLKCEKIKWQRYHDENRLENHITDSKLARFPARAH